METAIIVVAVCQVLMCLAVLAEKLFNIYQAMQNEKIGRLTAGIAGFMSGGFAKVLKQLRKDKDARADRGNNQHRKDNPSGTPGSRPDKGKTGPMV